MKYKVIITDITNYGSTLFCVAGWDVNLKRMIRPEPIGANATNEQSRFWASDLAGNGKVFAEGNIVEFDAEDPPSAFRYPHATEDRVVKADSVKLVGALNHAEMRNELAQGLSNAISGAFVGLGRQANGKAFVPGDTVGPSLGCVEAPQKSIRFYVDEYNGNKKLRVKVQQGFVPYDLGVTSERLRAEWRDKGVSSLNELVKGSTGVHIRLGLARPFPENNCFVQMNGAYFF